MSDETICFQRPREIDGTPTVVRARSLDHLREAAAAVGELTIEAGRQIQGADVGDLILEDPEIENAAMTWAKSDRGCATAQVLNAAAAYARAVSDLLKTSGSGP